MFTGPSRVEQAWRDVRHAGRAIRRMPGLAAVVVVSLGVGIGVNTAVFSWLQAVVLEPLPGVVDAAGFHLVEPRAETGSYPGASWPEYRDLRERLRSFPELVAFRMAPLRVGERDGTSLSYGLLVSDNYFSALGVRPAQGRFPAPEEAARSGGEPVVVVSHDFWRSRLGGAPGVTGRTLRVNDRELTIVGVAPAGFQGTVLGLSFDLWVPATLTPVLMDGSRALEERGTRGYSVVGRLRPGTTRARAQAEVDAAMREMARLHPETRAVERAEVLPFWRAPRGPQRMMARALALLQGILLLLLLAVCGNTASLMLTRASARQREAGVRLALGAGPGRLAALLLTESLVLALLGALLGAAVAVWATVSLRDLPLPGALPIRFRTGVDGLGLAVAVGLGVACGLLSGAASAVQLARVDPQAALRSGSGSAPRGRLRDVLVGIEVALALVVLVVAAMFYEGFRETGATDPGFRREGVLLAAYDFAGRAVGDPAARVFAAGLLRRLRALPGVESAAIASSVPLDIHGLPLASFTVEGRAREDDAPDQALANVVTPGYFAAMGIPLVAGRDFAELDDGTAPPQVVVNEEFVRRFLGGAEPIGRRLRARGVDHRIAGVARGSVYESFGEPPTPMVYFSYRDRPLGRGEIHLRARSGAATALAPGLRRVVRELDPGLPVYDVRTLTEHVEKNLFLRRVPARIFVVLGPLLLVLAAIGIYAVVAYGVARRTVEIGVRLALGASGRRVVRGIVVDSLRVVGVGALAGWLVALAIDLHVGGVGSFDPPVLLGVPAVLLLVATLASWIPARRATRVDPVVALRRE